MEYENQNPNNEDQIRFRMRHGEVIIVTELNTKIDYFVYRERHVGRFTIKYTRLRVFRTLRGRLVYYTFNNPISRFNRALVPRVSRTLDSLGISITLQ